MSSDIEDDYEEEDVTLSDEDFEDDVENEEEQQTLGKAPTGRQGLAIRRAIEERMERKQMDEALNYLELDFDEEDDFED